MSRKLKNSELNRISVEEFKEAQKLPIILVLDNVRSALNIGSAFRTSDGLRIEGIYLCGITAQPPHRDIQRTALGATDSVDWKYFEDSHAAIDDLNAKGYTIIAIEQAENKTWLQDFRPRIDGKYAVIFGNEVNGVNQEIVDKSDFVVEIPQFGTKHSFNISVSIGIVLWDFLLKMKDS